MNYYLDTEFHEYHKQQKVCGIKVGKAIPTIDLISIGIVSEDGRKYYAISKDFNIKDAWNSYQITDTGSKEYWLRENVLKPIFVELFEKENNINEWTVVSSKDYHKHITTSFTYKNFKYLINKYGKTNKQIAQDIIEFTWKHKLSDNPLQYESHPMPIKFYAYYADYDWVVFAQLFGKMIYLPKGFPKYCIDLKQELDDKFSEFRSDYKTPKDMFYYPKQTNEHNALSDAIWNKELHKFINTL